MKPFKHFSFRVLWALWAAMAVLSARAVGHPPSAAPLRVTVTHPGTLAARVGTPFKYKATDLAVEGPLNGTDLRFLREMAGRDYEGRPTRGRLRRLDLSRATFAQGGLPYFLKEEPLRVTGGPLSLPPYLFSECLVEEVVLPELLDTIGPGAFGHTALRSLRLPENVVVGNEAFVHCDALAEVIFPRHLVELGQFSFDHCAALRQVRIHDVQFVPYHAFRNVPHLEEIVFDGTLWHVDGWFAHNCPELRRIEFGGCVLTTGGSPVASSCPKLEEIVFTGVSLITYFGKVEDCPLLEKCQVTGYVKSFSNHNFLPPQTDTAHASREILCGAVASLAQVFDTPLPLSRFVGFDLENALYDLTRLLVLKGETAEAVRLLPYMARIDTVVCTNVAVDSVFSDLRATPEYRAFAQQLLRKMDCKQILRHSPPYDTGSEMCGPNPRPFVYAAASDTALQHIRQYFQADYIAGAGDELTRLKNVMYWVHEHVPHRGNYYPPVQPTAIDLYEAFRGQGYKGMNARGIAIVLSELYMSLGWPARFITCMSKMYETDHDATVVTVVWSFDLQKWVMMDASLAAYVTDENGLMLHPGEIRQRMKDGRPLRLNAEANWNYDRHITEDFYLDRYMAKNLYYFSGYLENLPNVENDRYAEYITLVPEGESVNIGTPTHDDAWFWQSPF